MQKEEANLDFYLRHPIDFDFSQLAYSSQVETESTVPEEIDNLIVDIQSIGFTVIFDNGKYHFFLEDQENIDLENFRAFVDHLSLVHKYDNFNYQTRKIIERFFKFIFETLQWDLIIILLKSQPTIQEIIDSDNGEQWVYILTQTLMLAGEEAVTEIADTYLSFALLSLIKNLDDS